MNDIRAIIFDMDGVLADSEPLHFEAEKAILQQHGIEAPWHEWHKFTGLTDEKIFRYVVDNYTDGQHTPEALIQAKYDIFPHILEEKVQPIPGVMEFLEWAKPRYEKLAVTTSSLRHIQETIFRTLKLTPYFDVVVTGDSIQHSKPHPEPYLKTLEALGLKSHECLVVEDSLNGVKSAKGAGCKVAGITTSFDKAQLLECGADMTFDHFSELVC